MAMVLAIVGGVLAALLAVSGAVERAAAGAARTGAPDPGNGPA